jgi:hypothetical protein
MMSTLMSCKLALACSSPYSSSSSFFAITIFSLSPSLVLCLLVPLCFLVLSVYSCLVLAPSLESFLLVYCFSSCILFLLLYIVSLLIYYSFPCIVLLCLYQYAPVRFARGSMGGLIIYWLFVVQMGGHCVPSSLVGSSLSRGRIGVRIGSN